MPRAKKAEKIMSSLRQLSEDRKALAPAQLTPETIKEICEALETPLPMNVAGELCGIDANTMNQVMELDPALKSKFLKAQAAGIRDLLKTLKQHSKQWWMAAAWMLERIRQEDFSLVQRKKEEVSGEVTLIIKTDIPRPAPVAAKEEVVEVEYKVLESEEKDDGKESDEEDGVDPKAEDCAAD